MSEVHKRISMSEVPKKNYKSRDPYKSDLSFKPARDYITGFLPSIERIEGSNANNRAEEIIRILDKAGRKSKILIPSIGPAKGKILEELVRQYEPKNVFEIGTLFGYSAIVLATQMPSGGCVTTIQKSRKNMVIAERVIKAAGLSDRIRTVIGDAAKKIPRFKQKIDMLFIDGYKREYYKYLKLAEPQLKIGSVVIADNVLIFEHEMGDFLDYVRGYGNYKGSGKYKSTTIGTFRGFSTDTEDALEVSIKVK